MKTVLVRSLSLPLGVPVPHLDSWKEVLTHFNGDELKAVNVLNLYGRQKDSLVNARDFIAETIESLGFKSLTKTEKRDGKDVTIQAETESKHIDRCVDAIVAGKFKPTLPQVEYSENGTKKTLKVPALAVSGTDDKTKTASVWSWIQAIINAHGDFPFDLKASTRVGKPKNPPKYALQYAQQIIANGAKAVAKWTKNFTEGYESQGYSEKYGPVEPIAFQPFNQVAPAGATPEQAQAVVQSNLNNLAWAISAVEQQKANKRGGGEYA